MKKIISFVLLALSFCTVTYAQTVKTGLFVGYVDYTNVNQPSLIQSAEHGYNMIVIGFGTVSGDEANLSQLNPNYLNTLGQQIQRAHDLGAKVLITLGGENNTFNPSVRASSQEAKTIAANIYKNIVNKYHFDGVDFDLESIAVNAAFVKEIISQLKVLDPKIIITGAPQASVWWKNGGVVSFAPAIWAGKDGLVQSGLFNYIFLQAYNQGGGIQVYTDTGKDLTGTSPGIIVALTELYASQHVIPTNTTLIIGEPSSASAGKGLNDPLLIKNDLQSLVVKKAAAPGLMTWSIGQDMKNNPAWNFSTQLKRCVIYKECS